MLTSAQKDKLTADVAALADHVAALIVDPDPNPLQVELDAANAQLAAANAALGDAKAAGAALQAKIDAAKASIQAANAADATEDAARADALFHLG